MDENRDWAIKIKTTITTIRTIGSRSYPEMSPAQAHSFEQNLSKACKIENFMEELPYIAEDEIELIEEVEIITKSTE